MHCSRRTPHHTQMRIPSAAGSASCSGLTTWFLKSLPQTECLHHQTRPRHGEHTLRRQNCEIYTLGLHDSLANAHAKRGCRSVAQTLKQALRVLGTVHCVLEEALDSVGRLQKQAGWQGGRQVVSDESALPSPQSAGGLLCSTYRLNTHTLLYEFITAISTSRSAPRLVQIKIVQKVSPAVHKGREHLSALAQRHQHVQPIHQHPAAPTTHRGSRCSSCRS